MTSGARLPLQKFPGVVHTTADWEDDCPIQEWRRSKSTQLATEAVFWILLSVTNIFIPICLTPTNISFMFEHRRKENDAIYCPCKIINSWLRTSGAVNQLHREFWGTVGERVTGRKARGLQMEEIACKCQTFLSLLSGGRKQTRYFFLLYTNLKRGFS